MTRAALLTVVMSMFSLLGCEEHEGDDDAPLITTADVRPHADRGQCTGCHIVAPSAAVSGRPAPLINAFQVRPHPDRGNCTNCHAVTNR